MTEVNVPLHDLNLDEDAAHYVGILESTCAWQGIQLNKFRALLELLTGDDWETAKFDPTGDTLKKISVDALVKQTGMNIAKARQLVDARWEEKNNPANTDQAPQPTVQQSVDLSARARDWRAKQLAAAAALDETPTATKDFVPVSGSKTIEQLGVSVDAKIQ